MVQGPVLDPLCTGKLYVLSAECLVRFDLCYSAVSLFSPNIF